jgi:hypothetical protein
VLKVKEYFLFDPMRDWLKPALRGYRLVESGYVPIQPVDGRLPSEVLDLHLERDGTFLRLYDPASGQRIPTRPEVIAARDKALAAKDKVLKARNKALAAKDKALEVKDEALAAKDEALAAKDEALAAKNEALAAKDAENERLRRELDALRHGAKPKASTPGSDKGREKVE